jgi:16S rRNA (uracil1498-N3)-methyltransferase
MHVFFQPHISDDMVWLDSEESRHCVRVLRMRTGQEVLISDGAGHGYPAILAEANPKTCVLKITGHPLHEPARSPRLHMAVAPTKNIDRFEWFLEKATECGVDEITPVICENSERTTIKPERLEKILVAAMKQSQRLWLPVLNPAIPLKQWFQKPLPGKRMIAHCAPGEKNTLQSCLSPAEDALLLVGPEGDFSPDEIHAAMDHGFQAITLGRHRLRTETAAIALCIQVNTLNGFL